MELYFVHLVSFGEGRGSVIGAEWGVQAVGPACLSPGEGGLGEADSFVGQAVKSV